MKTQLRILGCGLPLDEANQGTDINVEKVISKPYFESHDLDVSRLLANQRVIKFDVVDRFGFLWDKKLRESHIADSILVKALGDPKSSEQATKLLVMEERAKEFFGVVGLKHSMYYDNDKILNEIANFIVGSMPEFSD